VSIYVGCLVQHKPSGLVRRVSGMRGEVVHFFQGIKTPSGLTFYWADASELRPLNVLEMIRVVS
jgi:hypothetical protein